MNRLITQFCFQNNHLKDWAGLCLPFCQAILPQLRVEEMFTALHLQIGLKGLCVGPKGDPQGTLKELDGAAPTSPVLTGSEMLSCSGILENI